MSDEYTVNEHNAYVKMDFRTQGQGYMPFKTQGIERKNFKTIIHMKKKMSTSLVGYILKIKRTATKHLDCFQ